MKQNEKSITGYLRRLSNILLINGGFLDNPGLYTGETGLVLFFFRYADYTKNELYREYSFELIEKIQNRIHEETPIAYRQGLTGIGSAIEYLVQKCYVKADTDEILEDFDNRIFSIRNLSQLSMEEVISIRCYAMWRIAGSRSKRNVFLNTLLPLIANVMEEQRSINEIDTPYVSQSIQAPSIFEMLSKNDIFSPNKLNMGYQDGLAGIGMTLLYALDEDISWSSLFPNEFIQLQNESLPV